MADGTDATPAEPTEIPTALYRHFDKSGALLYVGISLSALVRLTQHRDSSDWYRDIATVQIEWFPTRPEAVAAEIAAIRDEVPKHNVAHNRRRAGTEFLALLREERAQEVCAELTRKVTRYSPTYTVQEAARVAGIGSPSIRLAIEAGELAAYPYCNRHVITGWALIAFMEALESGQIKVRRAPRLAKVA